MKSEKQTIEKKEIEYLETKRKKFIKLSLSFFHIWFIATTITLISCVVAKKDFSEFIYTTLIVSVVSFVMVLVGALVFFSLYDVFNAPDNYPEEEQTDQKKQQTKSNQRKVTEKVDKQRKRN